MSSAAVVKATVVKAAAAAVDDEQGQDPCISLQRVCLHFGQQANHGIHTPGQLPF
jgi:hypothetical protein